jgi:hypothetical protein
MSAQYTFNHLGQLSHSAANMPCIYDRAKDVYRPLEKSDLSSFANAEGSTSFDSFGRMRISDPMTLFDSSHRYSDNNLWATSTGVNSSGVFNSGQGLVDLMIPATSGAFVKRETIRNFAYQPGKSLLTMNTFVMSPAQTNLRQRVGYFGSDNGIYLQLNGADLSFVKRTSVNGVVGEEFTVNQSSWNGDKLDGAGPSGLTLDITKAQILWMDIEWLGVGSVRIGFVINGKFIVCHSFHHANLISSTYITTATLPLRYEIENIGTTTGASTLKQICSTVISEGGYEMRGLQQAIATNIMAVKDLTAAGTYYPLVSLRLKSNRLDSIAILSAISILPKDNGNYSWRLLGASTTTAGTWVSAGAASSVEYNISGTAVTGGRILAQGFTANTNQASSSISLLKQDLFQFQLEKNSFIGSGYEISLALACDTATTHAFGSLDWEEVNR